MAREDILFMQKLVDGMVGIPRYSFPARRDVPRPNKSHCAIDVIEEHAVGTPTTQTINIYDKVITDKVIGVRNIYRTPVNIRFRLGFYSNNGGEESKVLVGWATQRSRSLMREYGYGFLTAKHISLETEQLEKQWNHRSGLSVLVFTHRVMSEDLCFIDGVENIVGCFYPKGSNEPIEIIINSTTKEISTEVLQIDNTIHTHTIT